MSASLPRTLWARRSLRLTTITLAIGGLTVLGCTDQAPSDDAELEVESSLELDERLTGVDLEAEAEASLAQPIAEVELGAYSLDFVEVDGHVGIVEYVPGSAPPLLDLVAKENPTALEVFTAVAGDQPAPQALIADHLRQRGEWAAAGGAATSAGGPTVRDFAPLLAESLSSTSISDHYDATCTFAADGQTYFDGRMASLGWDWGWYTYLVGVGNIVRMTPETPFTTRLRAHSCNNDPVGSPWRVYNFGVRREPSPGCPLETVYYRGGVDEGYRVIYYQTGASQACRYWAYVVNSIDGVEHSLGIMAP